MSSPPVQRESTLATSVLPTPASPSRSSGRCSRSARKIDVARPSSARYSLSARPFWTSSTVSGTVGATQQGYRYIPKPLAPNLCGMHDLVIRNGLVVDGTGAPAHDADVAIDGERITAIGEIA